jgi:hypothetical protein
MREVCAVVGYKTREKKRQARARSISAEQRARSDVTAGRWFLTICTRKAACSNPDCAGVKILRPGVEVVYRHRPMTLLCKFCAERDPEVRPRPSLAWERWARGKR